MFRVLGGAARGVGAALATVAVVAGARPVAKRAIKGYLGARSRARAWVAEASEQVHSVYAEAREEHAAARAAPAKPAARTAARSAKATASGSATRTARKAAPKTAARKTPGTAATGPAIAPTLESAAAPEPPGDAAPEPAASPAPPRPSGRRRARASAAPPAAPTDSSA